MSHQQHGQVRKSPGRTRPPVFYMAKWRARPDLAKEQMQTRRASPFVGRLASPFKAAEYPSSSSQPPRSVHSRSVYRISIVRRYEGSREKRTSSYIRATYFFSFVFSKHSSVCSTSLFRRARYHALLLAGVSGNLKSALRFSVQCVATSQLLIADFENHFIWRY